MRYEFFGLIEMQQDRGGDKEDKKDVVVSGEGILL